MYKLFMNYVSRFIDKKTRAGAFHFLMSQIQLSMPMLAEDEAAQLMMMANSFSTRYSKAFPWQKSKVVSEAINQITCL